MYTNCCQCCLTQNNNLLPLTIASSHGDDKTLWDYLKSIVPSFVKELVTPAHNICLRCSKALQVSYHFINIIKETEQITMNTRWSKEFKETEQVSKASVEQIQPVNSLDEWKTEKQFQFKYSNTADDNQTLTLTKPLDLFYPDAVLSKTSSSSNKAFLCIICNKNFDSKQNLVEHNQTIHKEHLPYKCKMCNFYSCYPESLFKHYKKDHNLTNVDLKLRQTKEDLSNHLEENPKFEIIYKCLKCNFESIHQAAIDEHQLENHCISEENVESTIKMFKCPFCHRIFKALKSAKIHYTMYHYNSSLKKTSIIENKNHSCEKCGALFNLKSGLLMHKRICDYKDAVNCNFCESKFSTVLKYEDHLQLKHMVSIKHECEICGKVFSCSEYLAIHRKRHNERYYQCDLCSKNYINNAELKLHKQRTHGRLFSNIKKNHAQHRSSLQCAYCDFTTNSRFSLKVHQYIHTGKPYKCRLCPKEFVHRIDLKQHCERHHSVIISNEELADMFKQTYGYTSRFDAFSKQNNNLEITDVSNLELDKELQEFGLTLDDIMKDLFVSEINNNNSEINLY